MLPNGNFTAAFTDFYEMPTQDLINFTILPGKVTRHFLKKLRFMPMFTNKLRSDAMSDFSECCPMFCSATFTYSDDMPTQGLMNFTFLRGKVSRCFS